jgi:hypothetical protein
MMIVMMKRQRLAMPGGVLLLLFVGMASLTSAQTRTIVSIGSPTA